MQIGFNYRSTDPDDQVLVFHIFLLLQREGWDILSDVKSYCWILRFELPFLSTFFVSIEEKLYTLVKKSKAVMSDNFL